MALPSAPAPSMLHFDVERHHPVSRDVIRNAVHAMALVWSRHAAGQALRVRLVFQDLCRHPATGRELRIQALCDPVDRHVQFALKRLEGSMGNHIPLPLVIIPTAAHEMTHIVQLHRGDPVQGSLTPEGEFRADYHASVYEEEARRVGLDVFKSMVPGVSGTFTRKTGEVEKIPAHGTYQEAAPYRIHLLAPSLGERTRRWVASLTRSSDLLRTPPPTPRAPRGR